MCNDIVSDVIWLNENFGSKSNLKMRCIGFQLLVVLIPILEITL